MRLGEERPYEPLLPLAERDPLQDRPDVCDPNALPQAPPLRDPAEDDLEREPLLLRDFDRLTGPLTTADFPGLSTSAGERDLARFRDHLGVPDDVPGSGTKCSFGGVSTDSFPRGVVLALR